MAVAFEGNTPLRSLTLSSEEPSEAVESSLRRCSLTVPLGCHQGINKLTCRVWMDGNALLIKTQLQKRQRGEEMLSMREDYVSKKL